SRRRWPPHSLSGPQRGKTGPPGPPWTWAGAWGRHGGADTGYLRNPSCLVPSDLTVAVSGGGILLQVHGPENGIFAVFFPNGQHGLLHPPLPVPGMRLLLLPGRPGLIVGEEVQLLKARLLPQHRRPRLEPLQRDGEPAQPQSAALRQEAG